MLGLSLLLACGLSFCQAQVSPKFSTRAIPSAELGRGVNFGNMLEGPSEGAWGLFVEEIFFDRAVEAGFDHIRLPVSWTHHALTNAPYTIEQEFFDRVEFVVDEALAHGLKVVLNNHHYDPFNENPVAEWDRALGLWQQIATRFQNRPDNMLVFEIMNEPHGLLNSQPELWNQFMADALNVIRQTNPTRKVMVGPVFWNSIRGLSTFSPPKDNDLIATVHFYEPFLFTHQGATWIDPVPPIGVEWHGDSINILNSIQNWSWNTTLDSTAEGLNVTYDEGYAGFQVHVPNGISNCQDIIFTVDRAIDLTIAVSNIVTGEQYDQAVTTQAGTQTYTVDVSNFGDSNLVTNILIQNRSPNPAAPFLLSNFRAKTDNGIVLLIGSENIAIWNAMRTAANWAENNNMPMYLGEFGAFEPADMQSRLRWTTRVRFTAELMGLDWAYWELAAGFGIYDPGAEAWRVDLLRTLIPEFE